MLKAVGDILADQIDLRLIACKADFGEVERLIQDIKPLRLNIIHSSLCSLTVPNQVLLSLAFKWPVHVYLRNETCLVTPFDICKQIVLKQVPDISINLNEEIIGDTNRDPITIPDVRRVFERMLDRVKKTKDYFLGACTRYTLWCKLYDARLTAGESMTYVDNYLRIIACESAKDERLVKVLGATREIATRQLNPKIINEYDDPILKTQLSDAASNYDCHDIRRYATYVKGKLTYKNYFVAKMFPDDYSVMATHDDIQGPNITITKAFVTDIGEVITPFRTLEAMQSLIETKFTSGESKTISTDLGDENYKIAGIVDPGSISPVYEDWFPIIENGKITFKWKLDHPITKFFREDDKHIYIYSRCEDVMKFYPVKSCMRDPQPKMIITDLDGSNLNISNRTQLRKDFDFKLVYKNGEVFLGNIQCNLISMINFVADHIFIPPYLKQIEVTMDIVQTMISSLNLTFVRSILDQIIGLEANVINKNRANMTWQICLQMLKYLGCNIPSKEEQAIYFCCMNQQTSKLEEIKKVWPI